MDAPHDAYGRLPPRQYEYMLAGFLLLLGAATVTGYHVYHGFVTEEMARERAYWGIGLPFVGVASGIYLFAYGWQRGDVAKALRMSFWLSAGALGLIVAILEALALKRWLRFGAAGEESRRLRSVWQPGWTFGGSDAGYYEEDAALDSAFGRDQDRHEPGPDSLTVHCRHCGEMFTPLPPRALCPSCGHSAIAG